MSVCLGYVAICHRVIVDMTSHDKSNSQEYNLEVYFCLKTVPYIFPPTFYLISGD